MKKHHCKCKHSKPWKTLKSEFLGIRFKAYWHQCELCGRRFIKSIAKEKVIDKHGI
ncbi:MAG: hypothetical protein RBR32_11555 [Bacteroidales bacterium]|nr:hypothetical protein [Bacteroidales bacterium]